MGRNARECNTSVLPAILLSEQHTLLDALNEMHLFALHYVYIPRINKSLKEFQEGWNYHGLRTTNHLSLQQLFMQGLQLHSSGLTALDFLQSVTEEYGDSIDDPMPAVEVESVTIHEGRFTLQQTELDQLQRTVDPLQQSDNHGIDLYLSDWSICILWVIHSMICIL